VSSNLIEEELPKPDPKMTSVDVWSYKDAIAVPTVKGPRARRFAAVVSTADGRVTRLEGENELILGTSGTSRQVNDDYAWYVTCGGGHRLRRPQRGQVQETYTMNEYNWNKATWTSVYLVSTKTGHGDS